MVCVLVKPELFLSPLCQDLVADYLGIPEADRGLFAIWVMSNSLRQLAGDSCSAGRRLNVHSTLFLFWLTSHFSRIEMQVEPHHLPLKMVKHWDELLDRHSEYADPCSQHLNPAILKIKPPCPPAFLSSQRRSAQ